MAERPQPEIYFAMFSPRSVPFLSFFASFILSPFAAKRTSQNKLICGSAVKGSKGAIKSPENASGG